METCYKAFRREVIKNFEIQAAPLWLRTRSHRPHRPPQISALRSPDPLYTLAVMLEGKKIGLADLFSTLYCILLRSGGLVGRDLLNFSVPTLCVGTSLRTLCVRLPMVRWYQLHATQSVAKVRSHAERGNECLYGSQL